MIGTNRIHRAAIVLLLLCSTGIAYSEHGALPSGAFTGAMRLGQGPSVRVDANLSPKQISMHFEDPFSCKISASFIKTTGNSSYYAFMPPTGGGTFCERLYPGEVVVNPSGAGLSISLTSGGTRYTGELNPSSAR